MWLDHPNFSKTLKDSWTDTSLMDTLSGKIDRCGANLSRWASKEFGNVRKTKKEINEKLLMCQEAEENEQVKKQIVELERELDHILKIEETMWHQRSRVLWLKDGDKNSSFFHQKASNRKKRNTISQIEDEQGNVVNKEEDIIGAIRSYYIQIFTSEQGSEVNNVLAAVENKVTAEMNVELTKPFTAEEVNRVIKQMHPSKAPEPDDIFSPWNRSIWCPKTGKRRLQTSAD